MKGVLTKNYIKLRNWKEKVSDSLFGNRDYRKVIIISDARTGSTLLMQLLNSHPEIIMLGEEFKNLRGYSCRDVWKRVFRKRPKPVQWVGFKLFYFHPWQNKDQEVWDFVKADKNIVIIHLKRKNILRSYTSKQIGLKTRKWTENINSTQEVDDEYKKVKLDAEDCRENFQSISDYIEQTERQFEGHKIFPVIYEDLDRDKQETMDRIFRELGVADFNVSTYMKKQNPEKLEDLIINFPELREEFSGTKWEYLFQLEE